MKKIENFFERHHLTEAFVFLNVFFILFLVFSFNLFRSVPNLFFLDFQIDSETLVIERIMITKISGLFYNAGLLGSVYTSQIGLQGMFFGLMGEILFFFDINSLVAIFQIFTATCSALIIVLILYSLKKEFGYLSTFIVAFVIIICSPYLCSMARNLYWVPSTFLLPTLIMFFLMTNSKFSKNNRFTFAALCLLFLSVFIKCACGYEFITTVLISATIPLFYFSIKNKTQKKEFFTRFIQVVCVCVFAFLVAISIHLVQLTFYFNDFGSAFKNLLEVIAKRTTSFGSTGEIPEVYWESLNASTISVLMKYFKHPVSIIVVTLLLPTITFVRGIKQNKNKAFEDKINTAGLVASWISLLAPLSWFIFAKAHSYIHTTINFVLFAIPFTIISVSYLCYYFQTFKFKRKAISKYVIPVTTSFYLLFSISYTGLIYDYSFQPVTVAYDYHEEGRKRIVFNEFILLINKQIIYDQISIADIEYNSEEESTSIKIESQLKTAYAMVMMAENICYISDQQYNFTLDDSNDAYFLLLIDSSIDFAATKIKVIIT